MDAVVAAGKQPQALRRLVQQIGLGQDASADRHHGIGGEDEGTLEFVVEPHGIEPDALKPSDIDETPRRGEIPRAYANRLAHAKATAALDNVRLDDELRGAYILAADTVVAVGRRILPKALLLDEAAQCLRLLSGRNHRVYTSICLVTPKEAFRQRLVETRVRFKRLSDDDIEAYLASGEWRGKAGGYAVQGLAGSFVTKLVGSYTNVVGLPLYETTTLLAGEGYPVHFGWLNPP